MADHCNNGRCTRPIYRGKYCFRCWAGVKWTSIMQRVQNKNGNNLYYENMPVTFTRKELIEWVLNNPPPEHLTIPSIDRVNNDEGYSLDNIRWLERNINSSTTQRDIPLSHKHCPSCDNTYPLSEFYTNNHHCGRKRQSYCRRCKSEYDKKWRDNRRTSESAGSLVS